MKGDAELITPWKCPNCGLPVDNPRKCFTCRYGLRGSHGLNDPYVNPISLADNGAAEEQLRLNRDNPWDSEAENNITRSLRVFRRWEDE